MPIRGWFLNGTSFAMEHFSNAVSPSTYVVVMARLGALCRAGRRDAQKGGRS